MLFAWRLVNQCLAVVLAGGSVLASDPGLQPLRSTLVAMRGKPVDLAGPRGATPQLTAAKHQLRDWIETRLQSLDSRADVREFERSVNAALRQAGLSGGAENPTGYLGDVSARRSGAFLIVTTGVGIECGFDESAYIYSFGDKWTRVWQNEQNTYTKKDYTPQTLHAVQISPYNKANDYVVLTLGSESWCASAWHNVYYRVFRLGPDLRARPLVDREEPAFLGAHYPPIQGSAASGDVLIEYAVGSIDVLVHNREAIRHYEIERGEVRRVDPLALNPRDFVDEWLTTAWKEAVFWSEDAHRRSTLEWHRKLHKDYVRGQFLYPTKHCAAAPDLWQVGVDFRDPPPPIGSEPQGTYFLVRWKPPYRFRMVEVSDRPSPECAEEDSRPTSGGRCFQSRNGGSDRFYTSNSFTTVP